MEGSGLKQGCGEESDLGMQLGKCLVQLHGGDENGSGMIFEGWGSRWRLGVLLEANVESSILDPENVGIAGLLRLSGL